MFMLVIVRIGPWGHSLEPPTILILAARFSLEVSCKKRQSPRSGSQPISVYRKWDLVGRSAKHLSLFPKQVISFLYSEIGLDPPRAERLRRLFAPRFGDSDAPRWTVVCAPPLGPRAWRSVGQKVRQT